MVECGKTFSTLLRGMPKNSFLSTIRIHLWAAWWCPWLKLTTRFFWETPGRQAAEHCYPSLRLQVLAHLGAQQTPAGHVVYTATSQKPRSHKYCEASFIIILNFSFTGSLFWALPKVSHNITLHWRWMSGIQKNCLPNPKRPLQTLRTTIKRCTHIWRVQLFTVMNRQPEAQKGYDLLRISQLVKWQNNIFFFF